MIFLNPNDRDEDELQVELKKLATETVFAYDFLVQECRYAVMNDKILVLMEHGHYIFIDLHRLETDGEEEIKSFVEKWAGPEPVRTE